MQSKKTLTFLIIAVTILLNPCISDAQSDWEFYFFGVNLKTFKNGNWAMITAGAVTSMLAHELGHVLYLESQGKNWNLLSSSSGLAVHTNNHLSDRQTRNLGRSGFLFQAGIGAILTSFGSTKNLDFTKGWASMNAAQFWSYNLRSHDNGDDMELIKRGASNSDLDMGALSFISQHNLMKSSSPHSMLFNMPYSAKSTSSSEVAGNTDIFLSDKQFRNPIRRGFAFQAGTDTKHTKFRRTKHIDAIKGRNNMSVAQLW